MNKLILLAAALLLGGCGPYLSLVSPAPPNRTITVRSEPDRIEISEGVAVAIDCHRYGEICRDMRAVSSAPDVAGVYPAHIAEVTRAYAGQSSTTSLALVGMKPGTTTLEVWADGHSTQYQVVVLPVASVTAGGATR